MAAEVNNTEKTALGEDRVTRYGLKIVDKPGNFRMVSKHALHFDHDAYQRDQRQSKIVEISTSWSWVACGAITVADRNSRYYVMDGGHRVLAAMRRSDIAELPCIVFCTQDVREEATGFLNVNTHRKPLTAVDKFKALVTTENDAAMLIQRILAASGRSMTNSKTHSARCVGALVHHAETNRETLLRAWPVLDQVCRDKAIDARLLGALVYLLSRAEAAKDADRILERMVAMKLEDLQSSMYKASAFRGHGGDGIWAEGVLQRLNHGLRNRIVVPGVGGE